MDGAELVAIEGLVVRRGGFALEVPRWSVPAGCVVGVVGPNGAGKSTLLELLAGLRAAGAGSVRVLGRDPVREPVAVRSAVGFMSADQAVFDLRIGPLLRRVSGYYPTWDAALVDDLLARFGLDPTRRARELSRGEATRLRLVLALAFRPRLLVLDEPTDGLDVAGRRELMAAVLDAVASPERSVVVSTHRLEDVARLADRVLVLRGGRPVHDGPTDALVEGGRSLEEALAGLEAGR